MGFSRKTIQLGTTSFRGKKYGQSLPSCFNFFLAPKKGGLYFDLGPPVCLSVCGQRFLRSVWVNWFETLGQEQVRSEDYARQIDFWYHSKWRPGGHLGCRQTWSRNSNNTNWISFKLGAERTLGVANMYAYLFSVRFKKWRHGGHICVLTPMITHVLAYISKIVQDRGLVTIIDI